MHTLNAAVLGVLEGLTEFIPVSSTGHLLLAERWLGQRPDWFNVFIQIGAAAALLPIFWRKLVALFNQASGCQYLAKLLMAFVVTALGGFLMDRAGFRLPETVQPVAWATLVGAIVIFAVEWWRKDTVCFTQVTWGIAIACGFAQLLAAAFPGTSRSGATIMVALAMGLARTEAAEFSFILGMATLGSAASYKFLDAWRHGEVSGSLVDATVALLFAAVSAFLVVRWLLWYVRGHSFVGFAIYRTVLGLLLLFEAG